MDHDVGGGCNTATTSPCETGGRKYDTGTIGNLGGICGVARGGIYRGCYIKQQNGI